MLCTFDDLSSSSLQKAVFLASADAGLVVLSTLQHAKEKSKALKHFTAITNGAHDWITRPDLFVIDIIIWCDSYQLVMRIAKVGFFFVLFRWWASFIGQLHQQKKQSNLWALPKQIPLLYYYSPFGLLMWVQEENFLGKGYGIMCVMLLRTHWELIGDLRNNWDHN